MNSVKTIQALAAITDEGLFESLSTAILRESNPYYRALIHPGVNVAGKTIKSPLDGICFVQGAAPPHMVAVHHTITVRDGLENKWLHDPSKVKPQKGLLPTAPPGDLIKTGEIVAEERKRTPNLRATLVLTTNQEPKEDLVRDVEAAGRHHNLEIDLWSRSRLSHFLDNDLAGQWIRRSFLGIEQELLSAELLQELSRKSLEIYRPPDNQLAWIPRGLDVTLKSALRRDVTFLVAESGLGKSVACYRVLAEHVQEGGFGIVLPHETVASALTLEQAVTMTLTHLHPSLSVVGRSALSFCSPKRPLILVVEDVNRSSQTQLLVEKITSWSHVPTKEEKGSILSAWHIVCPLWPGVIATIGDQAQKRIQPLLITTGSFTENEGRDAVLARAEVAGRKLSSLSAVAISQTLGHDPLLIALHEQSNTADPNKVISQFVERSLLRAAAAGKDFLAADYRRALQTLTGEMILKRQFDLKWDEISSWSGLKGQPLRLLVHLAHHGELIRLTGASESQGLSFRHDRVRDWLLADGAADMDRRDLLQEEIVSEPYFAEMMGAVLVSGRAKPGFLNRVASANPLALFHALRVLGHTVTPDRQLILQAMNDWLDKPTTHDRSNLHARWEALAMLSETDSPEVPDLVRKFRERSDSGELARLRNGDLSGGIELCSYMEPGLGYPWRDIQIEHAKLRYGHNLAKALDGFLRRPDLNSKARVGALRLAGHIADASLASAIEACWTIDDKHTEQLADYLWAFAECCPDDADRFLGPVCAAWGTLSDEPEKDDFPSPRDELAAHGLRWAFRKWPPVAAIEYFVKRGSQDDLRWQITYMLHGIDHPKAIFFVVQELAAIARRLEGTGSFSPFLMSAKDDWQREQEEKGRPMSKSSRDLLLGLWQDETNDKHLRRQAFSFWSTIQGSEDIKVLRAAAVKSADQLADDILGQRLARRDEQAIPAMIEKLAADEHGYWWQYGRHLWSQELTQALDHYLENRGARAKLTCGESFDSDWRTHEMIMRLPEDEAEMLLLKHWAHLRFGPHFVQTALYVSTPRLLEMAKATIDECPEPAKLMKQLGWSWGLGVQDRPGIVHEAQLRALVPYLHFLSPLDIWKLWEACNKKGWFTIRRDLLDGRLQPEYKRNSWDRDQFIAQLDKIVAENYTWFEHWIDEFVNAGTSWAEIFSTMKAWLEERQSFEALKVVAAVVVYQGTRDDMGGLRTYESMPETEAAQLIANTRFSVRRRSLR